MAGAAGETKRLGTTVSEYAVMVTCWYLGPAADDSRTAEVKTPNGVTHQSDA
jgi:hypothetical protein